VIRYLGFSCEEGYDICLKSAPAARAGHFLSHSLDLFCKGYTYKTFRTIYLYIYASRGNSRTRTMLVFDEPCLESSIQADFELASPKKASIAASRYVTPCLGNNNQPVCIPKPEQIML